MQLALVMLGGAVGAAFRYKIHGWLLDTGGPFPVGTLLVNVTGALLAGFPAPFLLTRTEISSEARTAVVIGLLGGYTTFSTFSVETITLANDGEWSYFAVNIVASVGAALLAAWAGQALAKQF